MKENSQSVPIGVIGCGFIFSEIYTPILKSLESRVNVSCVCDVRATSVDAALKKFPKARGYTDIGKLFREETPSAMMVLTSEAFNASSAAISVKAGVPVYLEKPPVISFSEWEFLHKLEVESAIPIYTAFNRRLTPLFQEWGLPEGERLKKITGYMSRLKRRVDTFPFTAVHLIDSMQYFGNGVIEESHPSLELVNGVYQWHVAGRTGNGISLEMTIIPDGSEHAEQIIFETESHAWKLYFPNAEATHFPLGRLASLEKGGEVDCPVPSVSRDPLEYMGYAPTFRDFLGYLENGKLSEAPHRLPKFSGTLSLLEQMVSQGACHRTNTCSTTA